MNGNTAQMLANKSLSISSIRPIEEFLEKRDNVQSGNVGHENDEQAMLKIMTLTDFTDSIGRIESVEATLMQAKKSLEVEHKKEIEKLEEEHKTIIEQHKTKLNETLKRHKKENVKSSKDLANTQHKKQALHAELQQKAISFISSSPAGKPLPSSNTSVSLIPECHICMEVMKPPLQIYTCDNGHLICSTCKPRVNRCHCTAVYRGRANAMEQMVRQIIGGA
jgi:hypothetical protein